MSGANVTSFLWNWYQLQKSLGTYGLKCWLRGSFFLSSYVQFADNYSLCIISFEQKITWITCNPFCYFENTIINNALWHVFLCRGRPVTSLGHQKGRRSLWEGRKFFELCPIVSNSMQHIFPGGAKNFLGGLRPSRVPGLCRGNSWFVDRQNLQL